jgi:hypothetical protein
VAGLLAELRNDRQRRVTFSSISVGLNNGDYKEETPRPESVSQMIRLDGPTRKLIEVGRERERVATPAYITQTISIGRQVIEQLLNAEGVQSSGRGSRSLYTGPELARLGACLKPCASSGQIDIQHPSWGEVTLVTTLLSSLPDGSPNSAIVAIDSHNRVMWRHDTGDQREFSPAKPATDKSGNVFIIYNPGRHNGVIILRASKVGFDDFDSLPSPSNYGPRFYDASITDTDHDGILEIAKPAVDCQPKCADGKPRRDTYRWTGNNYLRR